MTQDTEAELPEVKPTPTVEPRKLQVEEEGEFQRVTIQEVDDLFAKSGPSYIDLDNNTQRQQNLERIQIDNPEEYQRLNDINTRRLKELAGLQPPEFNVTEDHLKYPGLLEDVKQAIKDLPVLKDALNRSEIWKERWDSLSPKDQELWYGRMDELRRGSDSYKTLGGGRQSDSTPEQRRSMIWQSIPNMVEGRLKNQIEKLSLAVRTKENNPIVLRGQTEQYEQLAQVRSEIKEADTSSEKPPQEILPSPQRAKTGGFLGRIFGKK